MVVNMQLFTVLVRMAVINQMATSVYRVLALFHIGLRCIVLYTRQHFVASRLDLRGRVQCTLTGPCGGTGHLCGSVICGGRSRPILTRLLLHTPTHPTVGSRLTTELHTLSTDFR